MKICFALLDNAGVQTIACAHEDEEGKGVYIGHHAQKFHEMTSEKQVEILNEMIIAVTKAADVKRDIKFGDYQR